MIERPLLIVMAKAPRIGLGKQRLAADIGAVEAWRINRALHAHTLRAAFDPRWRTLWRVAPDSARNLPIPGIWPQSDARAPQGDGDLGARIARALKPHRNVAIIGTDCPGLTRAHIAEAFAGLRRAPLALGPTPDGGFWILAARSGAIAARAMAPVRWSSADAACDVLRNYGADYTQLPRLQDIDTATDLRAWTQRSATRVSSLVSSGV